MKIELNKITLRQPDNWHLHLREDNILALVLWFTVYQFARALVMCNTKKPITTAEEMIQYREQILRMLESYGLSRDSFQPLMTIQLTPELTPKEVVKAKKAGAVAIKIYPQGVTTNSNNGVVDLKPYYPIFSAARDEGLAISNHGEAAEESVFCLDKEDAYLQSAADIADTFPGLKVVLEHITTRTAINLVRSRPHMAATITLQAMTTCLDDILGYSKKSGGLMRPHWFCKTVVKRPEDRDALLAVAMSGDPKFFFGSDSAPHDKLRVFTEKGGIPAGAFSEPGTLAALADLFERANQLPRLEPFLSEFGARYYGVPLNEGTISLVREEEKIPYAYPYLPSPSDPGGVIVPFLAGQTVNWKVATIEP